MGETASFFGIFQQIQIDGGKTFISGILGRLLSTKTLANILFDFIFLLQPGSSAKRWTRGFEGAVLRGGKKETLSLKDRPLELRHEQVGQHTEPWYLSIVTGWPVSRTLAICRT